MAHEIYSFTDTPIHLISTLLVPGFNNARFTNHTEVSKNATYNLWSNHKIDTKNQSLLIY